MLTGAPSGSAMLRTRAVRAQKRMYVKYIMLVLSVATRLMLNCDTPTLLTYEGSESVQLARWVDVSGKSMTKREAIDAENV